MGRVDLVAFDCDSTLVGIEGVDELALRAGLGAQVAALTTEAMAGNINLEEVYGRRLDLIRPSSSAVAWLGQRYVETLIPGAREIVAALLGQGREVHIISGGLRPAILVLAAALGIRQADVHAVEVYFDANGDYAGFAGDSPPARSGGKAEVIRELAAGNRNVVMIGDGATDLEAATGGALVIGFGGVVARDVVRQGADLFCDEPSLWPCLDLIERLDAEYQ